MVVVLHPQARTLSFTDCLFPHVPFFFFQMLPFPPENPLLAKVRFTGEPMDTGQAATVRIRWLTFANQSSRYLHADLAAALDDPGRRSLLEDITATQGES